MIDIRPIPAFDDNYIWLLSRPGYPGCAVVDPGDDDIGEEVPFVCPCWDFQNLVDAIQCDDYRYQGHRIDSSDDDSGIDALSLRWEDPVYYWIEEVIQLHAGKLFEGGVSECREIDLVVCVVGCQA